LTLAALKDRLDAVLARMPEGCHEAEVVNRYALA
jgi:hypothetical protein